MKKKLVISHAGTVTAPFVGLSLVAGCARDPVERKTTAELEGAAFDEMETKYGTIEAYFSEALGIDAAQQQAIRDLYLGQN